MFKIGDEVEVINKERETLGFKGIITDMDEDYIPEDEFEYLVTFNNYCWHWYSKEELKPLTPKPFAKDDLQDGDIVVTRNKYKFIVFEGMLFSSNLDLYVEHYLNDLIYKGMSFHKEPTENDIMQVTRNGEVIFSRDDKSILKHIRDYLKENDVEIISDCSHYNKQSKNTEIVIVCKGEVK